jgi:hypothetical protein
MDPTSIISTCKPQLWKCLTLPPKQWTHSTHPLEEKCFITGQCFTTACLAWSSAIRLLGLSHFNKTTSRMHSHLHFNKIHNIITTSYNTSIFPFGQKCVCEMQKYWMTGKLSTLHVTVYEFCLQHIIKTIFRLRNLFQVTTSANSAINLPSKLSILWYMKCTRI